MKTYNVNFYPIHAIVEAKNKEEAEQEALNMLYQGEFKIEVESIKEDKNTKKIKE